MESHPQEIADVHKVKKFPFPKSARLRLKRSFELVFSEGKKTMTRDLVMWALTKPEAPEAVPVQQLGLVVGKKTGGAVERNRLKRLIREAFRLSKNGLKGEARIIIYPKSGCRIVNLAQARVALTEIWSKAKIAQ